MSTGPIALALPTQDFASKAAAVLLGFITRLTALKGGAAEVADFEKAGRLLAEKLHSAPETLTPAFGELSSSQRHDIMGSNFPLSLLIEDPISHQIIIPPEVIEALCLAIFESFNKEHLIANFLDAVKTRTGIKRFQCLSGDNSVNPLASQEFDPTTSPRSIIEDAAAQATVLRLFNQALMSKSETAIVLRNWLALQQYKSP